MNPSSAFTQEANNSVLSSYTTHSFSSENPLLNKRRRNPQSDRGWTRQEVKLLLKLNKKYPHNWQYISRMLKTKTAIQCSYKMEKIVDEMEMLNFSRVDDITLIDLAYKYNKDWGTISNQINNKFSPRLLKKRYYEVLLPEIVSETSKSERRRLTDLSINLIPKNEKIITIKNTEDTSLTISISSNFANLQTESGKIFPEAQGRVENELKNLEKKPNVLCDNKKVFSRIRNLYIRINQLIKIMIKLDDSSDLRECLINKKKELALQMKNLKYDPEKALSNIIELSNFLKFLKCKIKLYLSVNCSQMNDNIFTVPFS